MKKHGKRLLFLGCISIAVFIIWTLLIQKVDVQPLGVNGTNIGFATFNCWFHKLTGVHMMLYTITDWLGLIPIFICMVFGVTGLVQLIQRRSVFKVDYDIIILGTYYMIVIFGYLIFEIIPINYRPILIEGFLEASYPSSTTLLVLCVMPTLVEQVNRRSGYATVKRVVKFLVICFSGFMLLGRLISGVSRTAISKWESGRGYPNIDSLKEISNYFSVTIDDLLSSEKLLSIAEKENKSNLRSMCDLLFGMLDVCSFILIVLPLYPNIVNEHVYSVNLFDYTQTASLNRLLYWILFISLVIIGVIKLVLAKLKIEKCNRIVTGVSMVLSILSVMILAVTREAYAVVVIFLLVVIKGVLLLNYIKR